MKCILVLTVALVFSGCGNNRLLSVTIAPATVVAKGSQPSAQFTATGTYSDSSKPVPLSNVIWCVGSSNGRCNELIVAAATIDSTGRATCVKRGTVTILAGQGTSMGLPDRGFQLNVFGSAALTCP